MITTFHLDGSELDEEFIKKIRAVYQNKRLLITVEEEDDATSYLLSTSQNREKFRKSVSELEAGQLIEKTLEELRK